MFNPGYLWVLSLELTIRVWWTHQWVHNWMPRFPWPHICLFPTDQQWVVDPCASLLLPWLTVEGLTPVDPVPAYTAAGSWQGCIIFRWYFAAALPILWLVHYFHLLCSLFLKGVVNATSRPEHWAALYSQHPIQSWALHLPPHCKKKLFCLRLRVAFVWLEQGPKCLLSFPFWY